MHLHGRVIFNQEGDCLGEGPSHLSAIKADGDFNCPPWLDRLTLGAVGCGAAAGGLAFGEDNRAIATIGQSHRPRPFLTGGNFTEVQTLGLHSDNPLIRRGLVSLDLRILFRAKRWSWGGSDILSHGKASKQQREGRYESLSKHWCSPRTHAHDWGPAGRKNQTVAFLYRHAGRGDTQELNAKTLFLVAS